MSFSFNKYLLGLYCTLDTWRKQSSMPPMPTTWDERWHMLDTRRKDPDLELGREERQESDLGQKRRGLSV